MSNWQTALDPYMYIVVLLQCLMTSVDACLKCVMTGVKKLWWKCKLWEDKWLIVQDTISHEKLKITLTHLRLFLKSIRWLAWGMAIKHLWKMFFNHLILFVRKWNTLEVNNTALPGDDGINDLSFYQIWVFMTIFLSQIDLFTVHPSYKETMHCKFNNTTILGVQLS